MGLFDKKYCDICGDKIGFLGNRKLEDGNLCKNCAAKLSPWFSDRRRSTVAEIKEQLAYREENKKAVAEFRTTRTLGRDTKVLLDEDSKKFMVTSARDLAAANPDVLNFSDVTGCNVDVSENQMEVRKQGPNNEEVSYNPPHYNYDYSFTMIINVNSPYFDEIRFPLNSTSITINDVIGHNVNPHSDVDYAECEKLGQEIKNALMTIQKDVRQDAAAAAAPKKAVVCPHCGATTTPDARGCCEFCGQPVG